MSIQSYLQKAYPYYYRNKKWLLTILFIISVCSFLFSCFFEPFELNPTEHKVGYLTILFTHAFLPLPIAFFYFVFLNTTVKDEKSWTLGKELCHILVVLIFIGVASFLIRDLIYTNIDNWSFKYLWEEIRNTVLVGSLLLAVILPLNLKRLFKKYNESSKRVTLNLKESNGIDNEVLIKTTIEKEQFKLNLGDFIFAKVEGNYVEVYTRSPNSYIKKIVRLTLKDLEEQLKPHVFIYKTHRSYLINTNAIKSVSGNAQGYSISLKDCPENIPVSRSKIPEFNALFSIGN